MARSKRTTIGIVAPSHGNSGKAQSIKVVRTAKLKRSAVKQPTPNLSNTYGFMNSGVGASQTSGAVTQGKPDNKTYKRAKRTILGKGDI